jgi:hypothetical protein
MISFGTMNTLFVPPFETVVSRVPLPRATFAEGLLRFLRFLLCVFVLVIADLQVLNFIGYTLEKRRFLLLLPTPPLGTVSQICMYWFVIPQASFNFAFDDANKFLRTHILKRVVGGVTSDFSDVRLGEIVPRRWQRSRNYNLEE